MRTAIMAKSASHRKTLDVEETANYRHIDAADFGDMENVHSLKN
jgi:hypothetical protein